MNNKRNDNDNFLSKENVEMIWELIIDEELMKHKTANEMSVFQQFFINKIRSFYEKEKILNKSLMNMNKEFIENIFEILQSNNNNNNNNNNANIVENKEIMGEDIKISRVNNFEKEFLKKQNEFSSSMAMRIPEKPKFDDELDKPIGEMEDLIARTLAQRNFDIEQIQQNIDSKKVTDFLTSQDTSVKSEKFQKYNVNNVNNVNNTGIKYIKISSEELPEISGVIDIQKSINDKKHITWADEENILLTINNSNDGDELKLSREKIDIFSKLKMKSENKMTNSQSQPNPSYFENEVKLELSKLNNKIEETNNKIEELYFLIKNKIEKNV